ncbi:MAG: hypothetical protein HDT14_13265 [Oscillibacter sp.]|nr:hypothetical protein [Oscillibacter sp.]
MNCNPSDEENIYVGNGEHINVKLTEVFDSVEMARNIPKDLQTFRYDTYVSDAAGPSKASRQDGIYGLLNEFTAYYWGAHNDWTLQDYDTIRWHIIREVDENGRIHIWHDYALMNGPQSYAEFRYWILQYMLYAKEHYPDVYQGILDNDSFRLAFSTIDALFGDIALREKEHNLSKIAGLGGYFGSMNTDYDMLMAEMAKPEYQEMLSLLKP